MIKKKESERRSHVKDCTANVVPSQSIKRKVSAIFIVETKRERAKTLRKYEQERAKLYSIFE